MPCFSVALQQKSVTVAILHQCHRGLCSPALLSAKHAKRQVVHQNQQKKTADLVRYDLLSEPLVFLNC